MMIAAVGAIVATTVVLAYIRSASEPGGTEHGRAAALATLALASGFITAVLSRLRTRAAWIVSAATIAHACAAYVALWERVVAAGRGGKAR